MAAPASGTTESYYFIATNMNANNVIEKVSSNYAQINISKNANGNISISTAINNL